MNFFIRELLLYGFEGLVFCAQSNNLIFTLSLNALAEVIKEIINCHLF